MTVAYEYDYHILYLECHSLLPV